MLLWIAMAVLAAAVTVAVLRPLHRRNAARTAAAEEIAVYRDQLEEVDRDLDRGLIAEGDAAAARTEIARRLIRAEARGSGEAAPTAGRPHRLAALAVVMAMPLAALGLYLHLGAPGLPDAPLAARLSASPEEKDITALVAKVEAHLAANPEDGQGWEVLAPVYVRLGRHDEAMRAYANALRILGSTAQRESSLGEAIVRVNQGLVTADARSAFERAGKLAPDAVGPRFYLALALAQDGKEAEAAAALRALLADADPDAGWVPTVKNVLAGLEATTPPAAAGSAASSAPQTATPGPSAADVEAAAALPAGERTAMIEGMVASLATRLESEPGDADGWARLVRSYMVLGRPSDARAALGRARTALAGEPERLADVEAEARSAGLTE